MKKQFWQMNFLRAFSLIVVLSATSAFAQESNSEPQACNYFDHSTPQEQREEDQRWREALGRFIERAHLTTPDQCSQHEVGQIWKEHSQLADAEFYVRNLYFQKFGLGEEDCAVVLLEIFARNKRIHCDGITEIPGGSCGSFPKQNVRVYFYQEITESELLYTASEDYPFNHFYTFRDRYTEITMERVIHDQWYHIERNGEQILKCDELPVVSVDGKTFITPGDRNPIAARGSSWYGKAKGLRQKHYIPDFSRCIHHLADHWNSAYRHLPAFTECGALLDIDPREDNFRSAIGLVPNSLCQDHYITINYHWVGEGTWLVDDLDDDDKQGYEHRIDTINRDYGAPVPMTSFDLCHDTRTIPAPSHARFPRTPDPFWASPLEIESSVFFYDY